MITLTKTKEKSTFPKALVRQSRQKQEWDLSTAVVALLSLFLSVAFSLEAAPRQCWGGWLELQQQATLSCFSGLKNQKMELGLLSPMQSEENIIKARPREMCER